MGTFNKYVGSDEVAGVFKYLTCTSLTCKFQVDLRLYVKKVFANKQAEFAIFVQGEIPILKKG